MKLVDAKPRLEAIIGKPFSDLSQTFGVDLPPNKGRAGQFLEEFLELQTGIELLDFECGGELKTTKVDASCRPLETMAITAISSTVDLYLSDPPAEFEATPLFQKINNLLIVPIDKSRAEPASWKVAGVYHVEPHKDRKLAGTLKEDYLRITEKVREMALSETGRIATANGEYLQIRTKDSKSKGRYNPIWSDLLQREVSNKNRAFYFRKDFLRYVFNSG